MTQLSEAIARYHRLLESGQYNDLAWAQQLQERMQAENLAVLTCFFVHIASAFGI